MAQPVYSKYFSKAIGYKDVGKVRVFKTSDVVKRLGVLSRDNVVIDGFPVSKPTAIFNPAIMVDRGGAIIYARIVMGYFTYVSSIIEVRVPLDDIYSGVVSKKTYRSRIVISPDNRYDIWGTEDPRVYAIDDKILMTYCGRTVNYFNHKLGLELTLPVTAVLSNGSWRKICVHTLGEKLRRHVLSDKDAFLVKLGDKLYFFHRPHMDDNVAYLTISRVSDDLSDSDGGIREVGVYGTVEVLSPAGFEEKVGWATPPIPISSNSVISFIHGVDREIRAYRLFAIELELNREEVVVRAVTPSYIMEPRMTYELFGDRPYTIFPCGLWRTGDKYLVTYGAGDFVVGIGEIDVNDVLGVLDRGRIY